MLMLRDFGFPRLITVKSCEKLQKLDPQPRPREASRNGAIAAKWLYHRYGSRHMSKLGIGLTSALAWLVACSGGQALAHDATVTAPMVVLPPAGAAPDYQLGGAYPPDPQVQIVARDREDAPAPGLYSICYINGFQTQPHELSLWPSNLILHHNGQPVGDPDWPGEYLLDITTAANRAAILALVKPWIVGCADDGFAAVEFDNLDTYTRANGLISRSHAVAMASLYVGEAHTQGLAAAQKNAAEDSSIFRNQAGFDFAVSEECAAWNECGDYTSVYGVHVIDIEYPDGLSVPFQQACLDNPDVPSMVLRDLGLSPKGEDEHVFELCEAVSVPKAVFADGFEVQPSGRSF